MVFANYLRYSGIGALSIILALKGAGRGFRQQERVLDFLISWCCLYALYGLNLVFCSAQLWFHCVHSLRLRCDTMREQISFLDKRETKDTDVDRRKTNLFGRLPSTSSIPKLGVTGGLAVKRLIGKGLERKDLRLHNS